MKIRYYLAMAAAALLMTNCSQDEPLVQEKGSTNTLTATIEGASRSSVTDGGVFSWNEGDAIAVGNEIGAFTEFVSNAAGVFSAAESIIPTDYAIYPSNIAPQGLPGSGNLPTITLPASYEYGSTHAPMLATIEQNATSLQFKHLAGLMRFKVKNVPAGADSFVLTTDQQTITGNFFLEQNETEEVQINQTGNATQSVTIKFFPLATRKDEMTFYIPMPVGEYQNLHVKIEGENLNTNNDADYGLMSGTGVKNKITRGKLLLMPTMVCDNTGDITLEGGANSSSIELVDDSEVNLAVANDDNVVVEMTDGANATLNLIAPANTDALGVSDGSEFGESQETSVGTLNVAAENVSNLTIDAPTLTVSLTAGTYATVEALTAKQTLIISAGTTIDNLTINGGNVVIEAGATVTTIVNNVTDNSITVNDAAGLKAAVAAGGNVVLGANVEMSETLNVVEDLVLNGCENTLTYTGVDRAISVESSATGVKLTVNNLVVNCTASCGRGINYNTTGNLTLENVTVQGVGITYAVNLPGSSDGATVSIVNSKLTGLIALNVWGENATISVQNSELTSVDDSAKEGYSAIKLNNDGTTIANGTTVTVTGGKITALNEKNEASYVVENLTNTGTVTIDESTVVVGIVGDPVAIVTYEGRTDYYTCYDLEEAINVSNSTAKVKLLKDITLTETLEIASDQTVNIDLNGKTINVDCADDAIYCTDFKNTGTMTIKNGKIVAANKENARRCIYNYGTMTIEDVEFTQTYTNKGAAINNEGTMTIVNATVNAAYYAIWNSGSGHTLTITNGTFISTSCVENYVGSENPAYAVMNREGAELVVNAGEFKGIQGCIATQTGADVDINGGTFTAAKTVGQVTGTSHYALWINNPIPEDAIQVTLDNCTLDASNSTYNVAIFKGYNLSKEAYVELTIADSGVTLNGTIKVDDDYNGQ